MKVKEVMMGTPYYCQPENKPRFSYGAHVECKLRIPSRRGARWEVVGVITDRDTCIALGTRNRLAGDVTVSEVMSGKLYSCAPDDDIHVALQTMKEGKVRRLPVISQKGPLVGVVSMDDIPLRTEPTSLGRQPELSSDEVERAYRAINQRQVPQVVAKHAGAA